MFGLLRFLTCLAAFFFASTQQMMFFLVHVSSIVNCKVRKQKCSRVRWNDWMGYSTGSKVAPSNAYLIPFSKVGYMIL